LSLCCLYLSQSFVEALCSFDQHEKLVHQIENILFQYVSSDKRMGAKDFEDLKAIKTRSLQLEIEKIASNLKKLNSEIFTLECELTGKDELIKQRASLLPLGTYPRKILDARNHANYTIRPPIADVVYSRLTNQVRMVF
jgi:hypothetical protein